MPIFSDEASCSEAIDRLIGDDILAQRLKTAALARAQETFQWQAVLEQYEREALALMDRVAVPELTSGTLADKGSG